MCDEPTSNLAAYAVRDDDADDRRHPEPHDKLRGPFEVDRHRVMSSTAFRRLERKTQVFAAAFHDHFRTRLTHTLEVAGIARLLAGRLHANADLAEVISLAHDLGHPPFGHAGEKALDEALAEFGGFNHNTHALRVVDYLEHPYPPFRGLNLTYETRRGLALHETRYDRPEKTNEGFEGVHGGPGVEALIASIADRIAVVCADLEDAIGAGLIDFADLREVELWRQSEPTDLGTSIHAIRRPKIDAMLNQVLADIVSTAAPRLARLSSPLDARAADESVLMSESMDQSFSRLETFMYEQVYRANEIVRLDGEGRRKVLALFHAYVQNPDQLPDRFSRRIDEQGIEIVARDYIAGMTDRFCESQFEKLADNSSPV